eukprot:gnl/TRDRNA2_/TRDRNA2_188515_c0_seq1.p1 gnl/TRDRNA2_/TRDRNA2_188515_c0~~gnl/TRDRNA2_/TRDRNA2_188515_c0_seq1.p1  ORF type:complete len:396 (+),score=70.68 gnl/TRDRNA2_/TRDRNA2_188515_c0_seq1:169-1356(+)
MVASRSGAQTPAATDAPEAAAGPPLAAEAGNTEESAAHGASSHGETASGTVECSRDMPEAAAAGAPCPSVDAPAGPSAAAHGPGACVIANAELLAQSSSATPRVAAAATGSPADAGRGTQPPLVIQADASLVEGLRTVLVHHLRRSVGTNIVNLSPSQAELLEHHLSRLASYAQKIVHTLAFATRFLSKQQLEEQQEGNSSSARGLQGAGAAGKVYGTGGYGGAGSSTLHGGGAGGGDASAGVAGSGSARDTAAAARQPRKPLKLSDDEIISLYQCAQREAEIEADWRGIQGPAGPVDCGGSVSGSSSVGRSGSHHDPSGGAWESKDSAREYLHMLTRVLQESDTVPDAITTEIVAQPAKGIASCCRSNVPVATRTTRVPQESATLSGPGPGLGP